MDSNKARGVQFVADRILNPPPRPPGAAAAGAAAADARAAEQPRARRRRSTPKLCFACHGADGRGTPAPGAAAGSTLAPSLAGSPRVNGHRDYVIKAVLHGLTGPIDGRTYPQVMVAMGTNKDQWVADVASYVRNSFGNTGTLATPADVARVRAATGDREGRGPSPSSRRRCRGSLVPDATWKVTASHDARPAPQANAEGGYNYVGNAAGALNFLGWTTGVPQQPGMWFQIELPAPVMLTEIQFTSSTIGGRGGAAPASTFPRRIRCRCRRMATTWSAADGRRPGQSRARP